MYKYIGPGFIPGIPARDLSEPEVDAMPKGTRLALNKSPIYKRVSENTEGVTDDGNDGS